MKREEENAATMPVDGRKRENQRIVLIAAIAVASERSIWQQVQSATLIRRET